MLSTKLQNDLMTAYQKVYEEKRGHAAGSDDTEKQASQLASDVRYKAKGKVPEGATEEEKRKIFLQLLSASPAPAVVKSMAKEKLLGEEVVNEKFGLATAAKKLTGLDKKLKGVTKQKVMQKAKDVVFGTTGKGKLTRAAAGGTAAYLMGRKGESDANRDKNIKFGNLKKAGFKPETKIKPLSSQSVKYEEVVHEMRFDDGDEGTKKRLKKLEKKRGMKMPDHPQFQTKKKDVKEGSAYGIFKGDGVMKVGKKEEEKAPRKQKGAMAYDGPNKERSEAADRIIAKTKAKREKMRKEELELSEMGGMKVKQVVPKKPVTQNPKDMSKGVKDKAPVDYRTLAQSHVPVGNIFNEKKMDPVGQEDGDINNDGKKDGTDKYLSARRKAIGKAIAKKRGKVKEGFSAWRIDLDFNEQVKK